MDLQLYTRVLWRFRVLIVCGLLLAVALAFFSFVDVRLDGGRPSFQYRDNEQWESAATVEVTSNSFLAGQSVDPETLSALQSTGKSPAELRRLFENANVGDFSNMDVLNIATLHLMRLAMSDDVREIMMKDGRGPIRGALQTFPVTSGEAQVPFINFSAVSISPEEASSLASRHVAAFTNYVRQRQDAADIAEDRRIVIDTTNQAAPASLLEGRKKTRPIIVFLAVMTAVIGLVFVLENLRPRVRTVPPQQLDGDDDERRRRLTA
jgi:hypothetical protein